MSNGYKLSDVPSLVERGGIKGLLCARGALLEASEEIIDASAREVRAMTAAEQRNFDDYAAQITGINEDLAEYKRQRMASNTSGLPLILPF